MNVSVFRFGGLVGSNGRQSLSKDDVQVSLSTPVPTQHMLLGAAGPLFVCVVTYGLRNMLSCAILAAASGLCQALHSQLLLHWPQRWLLLQNCTQFWSMGSCNSVLNPALQIACI